MADYTLEPIEDYELVPIEKPKSFLDRVSAWAGNGDYIPNMENIPVEPTAFDEAVGKGVDFIAPLGENLVSQATGLAGGILGAAGGAREYVNSLSKGGSFKDAGRKAGQEAERVGQLYSELYTPTTKLGKESAEISNKIWGIPGEIGSEVFSLPAQSLGFTKEEAYPGELVAQLGAYGVAGVGGAKGLRAAKEGIRTAREAVTVPDMDVMKPVDQPPVRPASIPPEPFPEETRLPVKQDVIYQGYDPLVINKVEGKDFVLEPIETPKVETTETKSQKAKRILAERKAKVVEEPVEATDPAYAKGEAYAQGFIKKNNIGDLDKVIENLQEKAKGSQYYKGILDTLERERAAKTPVSTEGEKVVSTEMESPVIENKVQSEGNLPPEIAKNEPVIDTEMQSGGTEPSAEIKVADTTVPEIDTNTPEFKAEIARREAQEAPVNEYNRLRKVGQEAIPGIRSQEAEDVGKVYEYYKKGGLTDTQWQAYVDDLGSSNKIDGWVKPESKAPEPAKVETPENPAPLKQGKPEPGSYNKPSKQFIATAEGQKTLSARGSRIAMLQLVNEKVGEPYTRAEIENIADGNIDAVRDWLIKQQLPGKEPTHFGPTTAPQGERLFAIKSGDKTFVSDTPKSDANHGTLYNRYPEINKNLEAGIEPQSGWIDDKGEFVTNGKAAPVKVEEVAPEMTETGIKNAVTLEEPSILEGEAKVTKAAKDINKAIVEKGFEELPEDQLATYDSITKAETIQKVEDMMSDTQKSKDMAAGREPFPAGTNGAEKQVLFNAVKKKAYAEGDVDTMRDLASSPVLATERSVAAQTLGASGWDNILGDPVKVMQDIIQTRQEAATKQGKKKYTQAEVDKLTAELEAKDKALKEATAREEAQKQDAAIDELIKTKTSKPKVAPVKYGAHNKIFTTEKYEKAKAELRALASGTQLNALPDPTLLAKYVDIGGYHLEAGARNFTAWSVKMVNDLGRGIEPVLEDIWKAAHDAYQKVTVDSVKGKISKAIESGKGLPEVGLKVQELAKHFVESGIKERNALVKAVHNVLKEVMPDITLRETADAISGYGKYKLLSKDEILTTLRDLKGQLQQVSKLEDLQRKQPPLKTGVERRTPSNEERALIKQVEDAKKKYGIQTVDKETQLKSSLDAIKTRLTNQIADLESQIASKTKIVAEKSDITYDAEANRLKDIRDGLKKKFDEIFADPKKTPSEKYDLAQKERLKKQIEVLEKQIQTREKVVKNRMQTAIDRETYDLTQKRNALRDASEKIFGKKEMTPQQRIDAAIKAVERAEAEYKKKVTLKDLSPMGKKTSPLDSAELSKARANRDFWKEKLQELRDIANPKKTPEQIANQSLKTRLLNETKKLNEKIDNLDFAKAEKKATVLEPETRKAKEERDRIKEILKVATEGMVTKEEAVNIVKLSKDTADLKTVWEEKLKEHEADLDAYMKTNPKERFDYGAAKRAFESYAFELKGENSPISQKLSNRWQEAKTTWKDNRAGAVADLVGDTAKEISENSVAMVGACDNSFIGRQGWFTLATHPTAWWPAAKKSFSDFAKTMGGKNTIDALMADVYSRPRYLNGEYQKAGLISLKEEVYPTSHPGKIPLIGRVFKASEAAFLGSALRMRLGVYDILADMQKRNGVDMMDGKQAEGVGTLVNSLTYRGKWGERGVSPWVRLVMWAPNIIKGQWDILTGHTFGAGLPTPFARQQARINQLKIFGEIATIQLIANAISPGSAETDPRASGWGTIKVGNQRFDYTAGLRQEIIFLARLPGKSINSNTGKVTNLYEPGYGKHTAWDMVTNLIGNKFTPMAGVVRDKMKAEFFGGVPFTWPGAIWRLQAPISVQQAVQLKDDASPEQALGVISDIVGMNSMNTKFDKTQKTPYDELFNAVFDEEEDTSRTRGLRNTRRRSRSR